MHDGEVESRVAVHAFQLQGVVGEHLLTLLVHLPQQGLIETEGRFRDEYVKPQRYVGCLQDHETVTIESTADEAGMPENDAEYDCNAQVWAAEDDVDIVGDVGDEGLSRTKAEHVETFERSEQIQEAENYR